MAKKTNKICIVDKQPYEYCYSCSEGVRKPSWYGIFCCENCKNIYETTLKYGENLLSKEEAKAILQELDLKNKEDFHPVIKARVNEIMGIKRTRKEESDAIVEG